MDWNDLKPFLPIFIAYQSCVILEIMDYVDEDIFSINGISFGR
jgi:hypothetical protein